MSKKHYEAAAKMIRDKYPHKVDAAPKNEVANFFANFFAADNPRFDRKRFLTACGL